MPLKGREGKPREMTYVATLINPPDAPDLTPESVDSLRALMILNNITPQKPVWLAEGRACDIMFDAAPGASESPRSLAREIASYYTPHPIDAVVQPRKGRRKKLLLADMDSTIIEQECLDELADFAGFGAQVAAITARAMAGELAFEPALRERVALLHGLKESTLAQVFDERLTFMPGAKELVATMKVHGAVTCLVSGGFTFFTSRVAKALGFDHHRGNTLKVKEGLLTGKVEKPILGREAKLETLREMRARTDMQRAETLAVGDGANDLAMIEEAGLGVAFHAHDILSQAADVTINHGDLTALLYVQGYTAAEICRS